MSTMFLCKLIILDIGVEPAIVETTDVEKRIIEDELKVAGRGLTSEAPAAPPESMGKHTVDIQF